MAGGPAGREPRFVFLCDGRRDQRPAGRYGWRLVAANHRPLGRGMVATESLDECRSAAHLLHREVGRLDLTLTSADGLWAWHAALDDIPLAMCVHGYARRVECARGLTQFLAAARIADPDEGVVRYFGPHSLRGYEVLRRRSEVLQ